MAIGINDLFPDLDDIFSYLFRDRAACYDWHMVSKPSVSSPRSKRLEFSGFAVEDAPAFAHVLSDPEVTRSIMAKATTPEQCLECARQRIARHNSSWDTLGYGVWALREKYLKGAPAEPIIGWSGLIAAAGLCVGAAE